MRLGIFVKAMMWRLGACSVAFGYVFAVACLGQMSLRIDRHEPMWVWWAACTAAVTVLTSLAHRLLGRRGVSWKPKHALISSTLGLVGRIAVLCVAIVFFPVTLFVLLIRRGTRLTPEQRVLWWAATR